MSVALAPVRPQAQAVTAFTREDRDIIKNSICPGASDAEVAYFLSVASALNLNPITREVHLLITESTYKGKVTRKVNVHAGIDGLRKRAMSSGKIRGIVGPHWADASGTFREVMPVQDDLVAARVKVYLDGWDFPLEVVAHWEEFGAHNARYYYDDKTGESKPTNNWAKMPRHMLGKVALSHALRSACPDLLAGVYSTDEIGAEESGGFTVTVNDETGAKKTKTVPRPGNAPHLPAAAAEVHEGEVVEQPAPPRDPGDLADEEAEAEARAENMEMIKPLLPQVFPGDGMDGVNWELVLAYCANLDGAGKLGRKYPMFKEWSLEQLQAFHVALADEWARKQLEPAPAPAEPEPVATEAMSREEYEDRQAAVGLGDPEEVETSF